MLTKRGFTLIELLVVIAIITILASIVAPRVSNWIERGKMAKGVSEVRNADLALVKMLADVERKHFGQCFNGFDPKVFNTATGVNYAAAVQVYTVVFYELLRRGKGAEILDLGFDLKPEIRSKLGTSYMDIGKDPWGNKYQFYAGPFARAATWYPFRSCRSADEGNYVYNNRFEEGALRGQPPLEQPTFLAGFPCPGSFPVYIYSWGGDGENNQNLNGAPPGAPDLNVTIDGHDDINNWDTESGWGSFY